MASLWEEKYQAKSMEITNSGYRMGVEFFVKSQIESYVGTKATIAAKEKELRAEFREKENTRRRDSSKKQAELYEEYLTELFSSYNVPREVCGIAYQIAHEDRHSEGYVIVEHFFEEIVEKFIDVYLLGRNHKG